jgi:hypothetical protein
MDDVREMNGCSWHIYRKEFGKGLESIMVSGCDTVEDARIQAEDMARRSGWTNPKWYEFWRWGHRDVYMRNA